MAEVSAEKYGNLLADWLEESSSLQRAQDLANNLNYNLAPFWGAKKRRARFRGELLAANTALALFLIKHAFGEDRYASVSMWLLIIKKARVIPRTEENTPGLLRSHETRVNEYSEVLSNGASSVGMAIVFVRTLGLPIVGTIHEQILLMMRFGEASREIGQVISKQQSNAQVADPTLAASHKEILARGLASDGEVGMMDVDDFDCINKTLGQDAGDQVMRKFRKLIVELSKKDQLLVCFPYDSGDEVLVSQPSAENVGRLVALLRQAVDACAFTIQDGAGVSTAIVHGLPVSIGCGATREEAWMALRSRKRKDSGRAISARIERLQSADGTWTQSG